MRSRVPVVVLAVIMAAACAGRGADASEGASAASELPIAAAPTREPSPSPAASLPPEPEPQWREPEDPVEAYRELAEKVSYMRRTRSLDMIRDIYVRKSPMARAVRREIKHLIKKDIRLVDGRIVIEDIALQGKDPNTAILKIRSREEGWVAVDADGVRVTQPAQCEQFGVELRDDGEGWRIARLIADEDSYVRSCDT